MPSSVLLLLLFKERAACTSCVPFPAIWAYESAALQLLLWSTWKWKEDQDSMEDFRGDTMLCPLQLQTPPKHTRILPRFLSMPHILLFPVTRLPQAFHNGLQGTSVLFQHICLLLLSILGCYHALSVQMNSWTFNEKGYGASPVIRTSSRD